MSQIDPTTHFQLGPGDIRTEGDEVWMPISRMWTPIYSDYDIEYGARAGSCFYRRKRSVVEEYIYLNAGDVKPEGYELKSRFSVSTWVSGLDPGQIISASDKFYVDVRVKNPAFSTRAIQKTTNQVPVTKTQAQIDEQIKKAFAKKLSAYYSTTPGGLHKFTQLNNDPYWPPGTVKELPRLTDRSGWTAPGYKSEAPLISDDFSEP